MDISTLSNFYNGCLRKTLIFSRAKVSNKKSTQNNKTTDVRTVLKKYIWRLIGRVLKKATNDITRMALRWTLEGKWEANKEQNGGELSKKEVDINFTWGETENISKNKEEWKSLVLTLFASGSNKDKVGSFIQIISFNINLRTKTKTKIAITYSLWYTVKQLFSPSFYILFLADEALANLAKIYLVRK